MQYFIYRACKLYCNIEEDFHIESIGLSHENEAYGHDLDRLALNVCA